MKVSFYKYHGNGNDFILVDDREGVFSGMASESMISAMCHRRFGIGADGLICIRRCADADFEMVYYNADGKVGSMCGNGGRCSIHFAYFLGIAGTSMEFRAYDGLHRGSILDNGWISLEMRPTGQPACVGQETFTIDTGSPHYVSFVDHLESVDVIGEGRRIRYSPAYLEKGINVNFVQAIDPGHLRVYTYERGVEDETYACGTGVTAAAIAHVHDHAPERSEVRIETKGGPLRVRLQKTPSGFDQIWLEGPVAQVYQGVWENAG